MDWIRHWGGWGRFLAADGGGASTMSWNLLLNSVGVTAGAAAWAVVLGVPVALAMQGARFRGVLLIASVAVLAMPAFFVAGMWMQLVGFAGAWRLGVGDGFARWFPMALSAFVLGLMLWPVTALILAGAWDRLDRRLVEAHPGLRGAALLRHLLWPQARGAIVQAAGLTAALALANFSVPSLFQARVWPEEVWVEFSTRFDAGAAFMKCWPLVILALALAAVALRRPLAWPVRSGLADSGLLARRLGRGWVVVGIVSTVVVIGVSAVLPLVLLAGSRRTWMEFVPVLGATFPVMLRSVVYAGSAATLVVVSGVALARWWWPVILGPLFFLPGLFEGIAWVGLFEWVPLDAIRGGPLIVVLALSLRYVFVGWFLARRALSGADPLLRDRVRLHAGGLWPQWLHVLWPAMRARAVGAWCVVYVLCLWDVETLVLIVPPGGDSLALMIFNLLHYGHNAQVSALSVWLGVLAVLPLVVAAVAGACIRGRTTPRQGGRWAGVAVAAAMGGAGLLTAGCVPGDVARTTTSGSPLDSRLFDSVKVIGGRGTGPGFFVKPRSVAVDRGDNVFVVDMTGRVQKFDREGRWLALWQMPETDKGKAKGMTTAADGGILVVEPHYHRVNQFSPDGLLQSRWGEHGTNGGQFWFPRSIAVGAHGDCFVSEYGVVERIQRFSAGGAEYLGSFGRAGTGPGELNRAEGLGTDRDGNVYVADSCNHRVQVFSPEGRLLRMHGRPGQGPGEFSYPYDVRVDGLGYQYVCEFGNSRVQVIDDKDRPVEVLGGPGSGPGRMNNPWGLCLDSVGNLYVADSMNHRVLRFQRRALVAD